MDPRYTRTAAGQAEIQARALGLSRAVRNLLLVIHPGQTGAQWLAQVRGLTADDLDRLLAEGLIAPAEAPQAALPQPVAPAGLATGPALRPLATPVAGTGPSAAVDPDLQRLIDRAGYSPLYEVLTHQAKQQLGLVRGYRLVLEVEKADGVAGLRALARQVVTQWQQDPGPQAVRELHSALAALLPPDTNPFAVPSAVPPAPS